MEELVSAGSPRAQRSLPRFTASLLQTESSKTGPRGVELAPSSRP